MSRSDLLVSLVKASVTGDKGSVKRTVESLIADERGKQHNVLADRLSRALNSSSASNGHGSAIQRVSQLDQGTRGRDLLIELVPRRKLSDLVLNGHCLRIVEQLIEEQARADLLRSHSLEPRHSLLLVGPPGNGKTSLAEAIAEALCVPLFIVRYDGVIGSFLGETASRLRRLFDYARTTPCVLFFDEFDAVGKERGDIHETGEIKRVVSSLLLQIDDLPSYVTIIAATNHEELLDRAAWRRFEIRIDLPPPTSGQVAAFLDLYLADVLDRADTGSIELAKGIGAASFAEVEQFCLNLRRRLVLSLGELTPTEAVKKALADWRLVRTGSPTTRKRQRATALSSTSNPDRSEPG
jgi:Cdc6-like AAA superfamily ATPase